MSAPRPIMFLAQGASSLAIVAALASSSWSAPPGWTKTWSDEFDGATLDTSKWDPILWTTPYNNERQAYMPEQVTMSGGNLVLTATNVPYGGKPYRSGKVESKFTQQYGRWEVRAKLPGTRGTWPAIWLLPDTTTYPWPSQGEIDIMENRGNQPTLTSSAYHYGANVGAHQYKTAEQRTSIDGTLENYHADFHVYAVEWDAKKLRFFVDEVNYLTVYDEDVGGRLSTQTAPVETLLNVAVGGDFLGSAQPNGTSVWPQQMLIDYVRVYARDADPPPRVLTNPGFEADGLASWSTFGNTLAAAPNVQVHDEATLAGDHSLKLFGQFNNQDNYSGISQGISVAAGDRVEASVSAFIRSADTIRGTGNEALLKIEFYREFGAKYGTPDMVGELVKTVATGTSPENKWLPAAISAAAPAGAVEARVVLLFHQPAGAGGAVHFDDVSFRNLDLATPADANDDAAVDGVDFLHWQRGFGAADGTTVLDGDFNFDGVVDAADQALWRDQYASVLALAAATALVPEPTGGALALAALAGLSEFRHLIPRLAQRSQAP